MILDSMSDPKVMWKRTISVCVMMLAAWAALIGTITLVMLVAISHAKGEIPASSAAQETATTPADANNPAAPKLDTFHPNHTPLKASTRI
jgi:cell division protein FtsN